MNPFFFLGTSVGGNPSTYIFSFATPPPPPPPPPPSATIVSGPMIGGVPIAGVFALPDAGVKCDYNGRKKCVMMKNPGPAIRRIK